MHWSICLSPWQVIDYQGSFSTLTVHFSTSTEVGLRELCWNNFENFEAIQYSSENNWGIIEHKRNNEEHNISNLCHRMVVARTNQGTELGTDSEQGDELISSSSSSIPIVC